MTWAPHDLRYAVRQLRKAPGFTLVAVLTLALGIGANTAIASAVYAMLLRSLPFHDADRLVLIKETHPRAGVISASYQDFLDWRAHAKSFESMAAYSDVHHGYSQLVAGGAQPQSVRTVPASADLFPALGIQPELGRSFLPAEDTDSGLHTAILSHRFWESRFAADPGVVGREVQIDGQSFTIVGVIPAGRQYPRETDLWLPLAQLDKGERISRQYHAVDVVGRLRPGVTAKTPRSNSNTIAAQLQQSYPATNRGIGVRITSLRDALVGQLRPALLALFGCGRAGAVYRVRQHRQPAAGAGHQPRARNRLAHGFGSDACPPAWPVPDREPAAHLDWRIAGILLARAAMPLLSYGLAHVGNEAFASMEPIGLNLPVLAFTALLAILTGVLFSLFPALSIAPSLNQSLRDNQRTATGNRKPIRSLLAAGEMALAVVVLFSAALLLRSFQKLLAVDPGFRTDHLLAVKVDLPPNTYAKPEQVEKFSTELQNNLERTPGVVSAAITNALPLTPSKSLTRFAVEGAPPPEPGNFPVTQIRTVSPSYFRTLGIGLRAGRLFEQKDVDDQVGTFIVNEAFARRYLSGREAVGSRLMMDVMTTHPNAVPVVGVVADAKDLGVDAGTEPVIYTAGYPNGQVVLVRTTLDPLALAPSLRQAVSSLDRNLGISEIRTMDAVSLRLAGTAPVVGAAAWLLRVSLGGTGGHRCLRSAGLRRHPTHPRDWSAHGAGRATLTSVGTVHPRRRDADCDWCRGWHARGVCRRPPAELHPLSDCAGRSAVGAGDTRAAARHRRGSGLASRPTRQQSRPDERPARRING